jgi:hypothetical protein
LFDFDEEDLPGPSAITTLIRCRSFPVAAGEKLPTTIRFSDELHPGPFSKRLVVDNFSKSFAIPSEPSQKSDSNTAQMANSPTDPADEA